MAVHVLTAAEAEILMGLDPALRPVALRHRDAALSQGLPFVFISGLRSRSQQTAEVAARYNPDGSLKPGFTPAAKPGTSKHEVGGAYDLARQAPSVEQKVGALGESLGLTWGGRYTPTPDPNHFEVSTSRAEFASYRAVTLLAVAGTVGLVLALTAGE